MSQPKVAIIMGSKSDLGVMQDAADVLKELGVEYEITVVSAHRTPDRMFSYARAAADRGIKVIIAGAGGAAHLPGMVASLTHLPVIGVPVKSSNSIVGIRYFLYCKCQMAFLWLLWPLTRQKTRVSWPRRYYLPLMNTWLKTSSALKKILRKK
jgi:phosphoribosylcarboxyaminoimidazole (NCAIR) mutase